MVKTHGFLFTFLPQGNVQQQEIHVAALVDIHLNWRKAMIKTYGFFVQFSAARECAAAGNTRGSTG